MGVIKFESQWREIEQIRAEGCSVVKISKMYNANPEYLYKNLRKRRKARELRLEALNKKLNLK